MKRICVIGSLNTDLVANVNCFPRPGQTIIGKSFNTYPGGKGANQAVALGRLGADVTMIGKVGEDVYGEKYLEILKENKVRTDGVVIEKNTSSGIALIEVDNTGENHIVIIPGANGKVDKSFIDSMWNLIAEGDIFLFQLEIPLDTIIYAMKKLKEYGKIIILDPAPANKLPDEIFAYVDYITPNESETEILTGKKVKDEADIKEALSVLLAKGVKAAIGKVGKEGAYIATEKEVIHVQGFQVNALDTTAAGDSFNAGFAFALSQGKTIKECVLFANAVGALSTTAMGAQSAMPTLEKVQELILEN